MRFGRARRGGVQVELAPEESALLQHLLGELQALLGAQEPADEDPLARLVGLSSGTPERPDDPALARLLPDAYGDDDEAAGDFRRYTEADLRRGKREAAAEVARTLPDGGGSVRLTAEQADTWLTALNDLRLVLGTRLEVTEDTELPPDADPDDPGTQALLVYGWLGMVQESLLARL